jgi:hypothetical protein
LAELVNDADGVRLVDTVLRFENLREELPEYLASLDICIDAEQIPHLRHSAQREQYQGYYDPTSRRLVEERYWSEIEEFGYEF